MSAPVTHDQLRVELARFPTREELEPRLAKLDALPSREELEPRLAKLDALPSREELEPRLAKLDALPTRVELEATIATLATKKDLETWGHAIVDRLDRAVATLRTEMRSMRIDLHEDLSRGVRAAGEEHRRELAVVDEKYTDLPDRVTALEKDRR